MRIIAWKVLADFADRHPEAREPLNRWRLLMRAATWKSMEDVRSAASSAKVINRERARFEIVGGNFRLVVAFDFSRQIAFVKFIGTHSEYDRTDATTVARY